MFLSSMRVKDAGPGRNAMSTPDQRQYRRRSSVMQAGQERREFRHIGDQCQHDYDE